MGKPDPSKLTLDSEWFRLSSSDRDVITLGQGCEGVLVFGQSGGAKTSSMKTAAQKLLQLGLGGIVFCVKPEEFGDWKKYAEEAGRLDDLVEFAPGKECFNFINAEAQVGGALTENIISVILDAAKILGGKSTEDTWDKAAKQLMRSLLTIVLSARGKVTIDDLYACIANMPKGFDRAKLEQWRNNSALGQLLSECKFDHPDLEASASYIMEEWPNKATETTSSVEFTLSTTIDLLRRAPLREWLCGETTIRPEDARNGKIIVINYPILQYKEAARLSQIIFKSAAQRAFERNPGNFVFFWNDEYQYTYAPGDTEFATTRRSQRVIDVALLQNLPLWYEKAGSDSNSQNRVMAHVGNMVNKFFFLNDCAVTNEWAAKQIGQNLIMRKNRNKNSNIGGGKYSSGQSSGESEQWDYKVHPSAFGQLMNGGKDFDYYTTGYVRQSRKRIWSNGRDYFLATFDQKIGQRQQYSLNKCVIWAFIAAFAVIVAQLAGVVPEAGAWLPNLRIRGDISYAMVSTIYRNSFYLFPSATALTLFFWLKGTRRNTAR